MNLREIIPDQQYIIISGGRRHNKVTNQYLRGAGDTEMNLSPFIAPFDLTLIAMSVSNNGNETWIAEVHINGILKTGAILNINNTDNVYNNTYSIDFNAGDKIQIYLNGIEINRPRVDLIFKRRQL